MNKKGDIESIIYIVIALFVAGICIFFLNHFSQTFYGEFNTSISGDYNHTQAYTTLDTIKDKDSSVWDYAFLALFFGVVLAMGLSAYAVRISPAFFFIYVILTLFVLFLGAALSNTWQEFAAEPEFASDITRFPIMNFILGEHFLIVITGVIVLTLVLMFGKPPMEPGT